MPRSVHLSQGQGSLEHLSLVRIHSRQETAFVRLPGVPVRISCPRAGDPPPSTSLCNWSGETTANGAAEFAIKAASDAVFALALALAPVLSRRLDDRVVPCAAAPAAAAAASLRGILLIVLPLRIESTASARPML